MRVNLPLAACYRRQLERLGLAESDHPPDAHIGSSDITHVSRVVPTIHPNFPIGEGLEIHSRAFAEAAASARGLPPSRSRRAPPGAAAIRAHWAPAASRIAAW